MNAVVLLVVFFAPIFAGCVFGAVVYVHQRRVLSAGFRHGRGLNIARLPQPAEPMPQLRNQTAA